MKVKEIITTRVGTVTGDKPVPVMPTCCAITGSAASPSSMRTARSWAWSTSTTCSPERGDGGEVMTSSVITVSEDTDVDDVRHLLIERRIRRVPVTSGQRLAGIVSRGDVVALLTTERVCQVCGEAVRGQHPPPRCPRCHAGPDRFVMQDPCPGD